MNEKSWELSSSAALDGELDPVETLELLDDMADDADCRENWRRARSMDRHLDPMIVPANRPLRAARRGVARAWWFVPVAAAALFAALLLRPDMIRMDSMSDPGGQPLTVRLEAGEMTDARFVELVVEVLQADQRYQEKMREVLAEVRPEASLAEAGSSEADLNRTERVAFADEESPATAIDELPWEALAGIH
jgi:hypothetical protein